MNNLTEKIVKKIEEEKITPKPKWRFLLKDYILWLVFGFNLLLGSVFFAVSLLYWSSADWDIYKYLDVSVLQVLKTMMPYVRLGALTFFIFLAYYNYRHTKHGYKSRTGLIIGMSLVIALMIGGTLFILGASHKLESVLAGRIPYYEGVEEHRIGVWSHPERGLLAGVVEKIQPDGRVVLKDFYGKKWLVQVDQAFWRGPVKHPSIDQKIKIIGKRISVDEFQAKEIRPWVGGRFGKPFQK